MEDFLPAIQPTFPDARMLKSRLFHSTHLAVIETSFLTLKECACDQFHFLIPLRQAPVVRMENKLHTLKKMSVFPCNPMQPHKVEDTGITDFEAVILYVEKTLLQMVAKELFGHKNLELKNSRFVLSPELRGLICSFIQECGAKQPGCSLMLETLSVQVATLLLRESHHNLSLSSFQPHEYRDEKCIAKAIEYITDNYQSKMSLFDLADEIHYSPYHLLRLFKRHTGRTPFEFLLDLKIEKAKNMLQSTNCTMTQICDACGFSGLSYFSQTFKKKTGLSPTQFKSQCSDISNPSHFF
ncbi:MAG: helix-turn-helix transcriptional regulator [Firmicutes bacterium]|nr:helix-turn-helix transcriptional regulator [Bacillota bacterium]